MKKMSVNELTPVHYLIPGEQGHAIVCDAELKVGVNAVATNVPQCVTCPQCLTTDVWDQDKELRAPRKA